MSRSATGGPSKEIYNPSNPTAHSGPAQQPGTPSPLSQPAGRAPGHLDTPIPHGPGCWVGAWVLLGTGVGVWGVGNVLHTPRGMGTLRGMGTGGSAGVGPTGSVLSCEHHGLAMDTQWHVLASVHTLVHADTRSVQQVVPYSSRYSQACPATLTHTPKHTHTPTHIHSLTTSQQTFPRAHTGLQEPHQVPPAWARRAAPAGCRSTQPQDAWWVGKGVPSLLGEAEGCGHSTRCHHDGIPMPVLSQPPRPDPPWWEHDGCVRERRGGRSVINSLGIAPTGL